MSLGTIQTLREKVLNVIFQIMLRDANAIVYINYPDKLVHKFFKQASKSAVDVFKVFNHLNCTKNLNLGVDAASSTGGFVEGTIYYTGDL